MADCDNRLAQRSRWLRSWHFAALTVVLASSFLPTSGSHTSLLTVMPPRPVENRAKTAPTPNPDGAFEELVISGSIRPARPDEFDKWFRMAPRGEMKQYRSSLRSRSFVILRPVQLPPGMYGAHSRVFIIPRGVPIPRGFLKSHNTFLLMDSGACLGTMCDS
jgi:hypothetical protein